VKSIAKGAARNARRRRRSPVAPVSPSFHHRRRRRRRRRRGISFNAARDLGQSLSVRLAR